ncbi:hypothetical protein [Nocardiopsis sp. NRRL B-16309]|uniref:hypothetical protein n=1 Tax=Nocardiopsis sp. NRRL B-16309 TaxID=1519494 RepID=UPI0006AF21D1|nr:hypothetical protein [Nocardiopsis sp. NRRL B-16309]KOX14001.1 hypothetical protein ADL05_17300 [Nocardiopsis sp. NRRL B-16309]
MLFSIPGTGWLLIAAASTAVFMVGMRALVLGSASGDGVPGGWKEQSRRGMRLFYVATPVFAAIVLGASVLRPDPPSTILFLYSMSFVAVPAAFLPVRARMVRLHLAQQEDPDTAPRADWVVTAWLVLVLGTACAGSTAALLVSMYGT